MIKKMIGIFTIIVLFFMSQSQAVELGKDEDFQKIDAAIKNITDQAILIRRAFDANKLNVQDKQYMTLHREAFSVGDHAEIYLNALNMYRKLDATQAESMRYQITRIKLLSGSHCRLSKIEFDAARDAKRLPQIVVNAANVQSNYIEQMCNLLDAQ